MLFAKNKKDTASINMKKRCQALQAGENTGRKMMYIALSQNKKNPLRGFFLFLCYFHEFD